MQTIASSRHLALLLPHGVVKEAMVKEKALPVPPLLPEALGEIL